MWYEHQPFRWILENLSSRQITDIIVGLFLIGLFLGSYYIYLDTVQSLGSNPESFKTFRNIIIFSNISQMQKIWTKALLLNIEVLQFCTVI